PQETCPGRTVTPWGRHRRDQLPCATILPGPPRGDAWAATHRRRVRVAESVYPRVDRKSGKPVPGKYEFTYRDATGRQVWQTVKGDTKADAKAERAELVARMHLGERVRSEEHTSNSSHRTISYAV